MRKNKQVICIDGMDLAFINDVEAAKWLRCSRSTIWRYVKSGKLFHNHRIYTMPYDVAIFENKRFHEGYCDTKEWVVCLGDERFNEDDRWFYDLNEAAKWLGCSKQYLCSCIKMKKKCKGVVVKRAKMR